LLPAKLSKFDKLKSEKHFEDRKLFIGLKVYEELNSNKWLES
jgi:hypothetical protein